MLTERPIFKGQTARSPGREGWRAQAERAQEEALPPSGQVVVSCSARRGVGGLGRHLNEIIGALERRDQPRVCICGSDREGAAAASRRGLPARALSTVLALPPMRLAASQGARRFSVEFDAYAAGRLPAAEHLIAFNGTAVAQFELARRTHFKTLALVAANSHLRRVVRQHALAYRQYPLERSWARSLLKRNLIEYAEADLIYVASRYAWESFIEEGFPEQALSYFPLTPDPRFGPDTAPRTSATFDVVYVGGLTVHKGVPLLIDAFRALAHADLRLVLVGGWASRGMRRFVEKACAEDSRIKAGPGDPLPRLRAARLCAHPAFEDGFAYAPAEALACGVPAVVSEDTGMKELIEPGENGVILPTGDRRALTEAIDSAYRGEILGG
jgi:glycosyltransferase involved in cell wall biosynthesis